MKGVKGYLMFPTVWCWALLLTKKRKVVSHCHVTAYLSFHTIKKFDSLSVFPVVLNMVSHIDILDNTTRQHIKYKTGNIIFISVAETDADADRSDPIHLCSMQVQTAPRPPWKTWPPTPEPWSWSISLWRSVWSSACWSSESSASERL